MFVPRADYLQARRGVPGAQPEDALETRLGFETVWQDGCRVSLQALTPVHAQDRDMGVQPKAKLAGIPLGGKFSGCRFQRVPCYLPCHQQLTSDAPRCRLAEIFDLRGISAMAWVEY